MSQENVEAVRRCMDGWNRGDVEAWMQSTHPEIEWFSAIAARMEGAETVRRGRAELRQFWDEWHSVWDLTVDLSDFRDLGDTILAVGRIRTRGQASGVDLDSPIAYVFEFDRGLMRRARAYLDPQQATQAVGLSE